MTPYPCPYLQSLLWSFLQNLVFLQYLQVSPIHLFPHMQIAFPTIYVSPLYRWTCLLSSCLNYSVDPDQLTSEEANRSGFTLCLCRLSSNWCQKCNIVPLISGKTEMNVAFQWIQQDKCQHSQLILAANIFRLRDILHNTSDIKSFWMNTIDQEIRISTLDEIMIDTIYIITPSVLAYCMSLDRIC